MFGSSQMFATQAEPAFGATQASPEKKPRQEEKQTCLPVTIRAMEAAVAQRTAAGSDDLKFYGSEPNTLILVALVESVVRQNTSLELSLNDSTGRIKARYFVTDPQPGQLEKIETGRYISAFGHVRTAPATHFAINGIRVVESADEVSYHMIEAAYAALKLQTPQKEPETPAPKKAAQESTPSDGITPSKMQAEVAAATPAAALEAVKPAPAGAPGGGDLRAVLLEMLRAVESEEGLAVAAMIAKCGATEAKVREHMSALVEDGEAFQTIDDDHFATV